MRTIFCSLIAAIFALVASAAFAQSVTITSPVAGSSVASPVQFTASASGGSYPMTAMRVYVDNASVYTVQSASLNTSLALGAGSHYVVVVAWNSAGQSFSRSENITVGSTSSTSTTTTPTSSTGGVTVSSPLNGATVASPVQFVGSASAPSGKSIIAMQVYVDNALSYKTSSASVNTSAALGTGNHYIVMQAWDNTGVVYKSSGITVNVGSTSSSTTTTSTPTPTTSNNTSSQYYKDLTATSNWLVSKSMRSDGAISYGDQAINPYYSNLAAEGLTKDPTKVAQVQAWMKWYINHLNWPDKWGLYGTTYDYNLVNGQEVSTGNADSTDSYAATFLSLAWDYYNVGGATAQSYLKSISYQLDMIGGVLVNTMQSDGLTWAKPDYQIKYLMDNCEVYRGLKDLANVFQYAIGDTTKAAYYNQKAALTLQGINGMWMGASGWAIYKDGIGRLIAPTMSTWYPDATAQLFPVLYNVIPASDTRSQQVYAKFNSAWPGWPNLSFNSVDPFPWVMISGAAAQMGDSSRVNTYIKNIEAKYVNTGFPWTWYSMEAGWFMRTSNYMNGSRPY